MKATAKQTPKLKALFNDSLATDLQKEFKLDNLHQSPRLEKIVVSAGLGRSQGDKRMFEVATNTLAKITGQQPNRTIARKSIAGFKLREGSEIGLKVTLRGDRMYEFLDRLINIVIPRLRDFHGVPKKSFDGSGNYSLGFKEQSVFPELSFEEVSTPHGLQVSIITTSSSDEHARALLAGLGLPFEKENK